MNLAWKIGTMIVAGTMAWPVLADKKWINWLPNNPQNKELAAEVVKHSVDMLCEKSEYHKWSDWDIEYVHRYNARGSLEFTKPLLKDLWNQKRADYFRDEIMLQWEIDNFDTTASKFMKDIVRNNRAAFYYSIDKWIEEHPDCEATQTLQAKNVANKK